MIRSLATGLGVPTSLDISLLLRGFAAVSVILWHTLGSQDEIPVLLNVPGRASVWIFFVISGYVIASGFASGKYVFTTQSILHFYTNRILRIAPLFFLITAIAFAVTMLRGDGLLFGIAQIPQQLFAMQWDHDYAANGVFWTLGIELQFYAIFPLLYFSISRLNRNGQQLAVVFAWIALLLMPLAMIKLFSQSKGSILDSRNILGNMQHFLAGAFVAILFTKQSAAAGLKLWHIATGTVVGVLGVLAATALYHVKPISFWLIGGGALVDLSTAALLVAHRGAELRSIPAGYFATVGMAAGVVTYGLYAWHGLLLRFWPEFTGSFLKVFAMTIVLAMSSYILVERPILRLKSTGDLRKASA